MRYISFAYCFASTSYLWFAILVLLRNWKAALNRVCCLLILSFSVWALGIGFMLSAPTAIDARSWNYIIPIGACFFPSLSFWFVLTLGDFRKILGKWYFYMVMTVIPVAYCFLFWGDFLISGYIKTPWGWNPVWIKSIVTYSFRVYIAIYMGASFVLGLRIRKTGTRIIRKQISIIFITAFIPFLLGMGTDVVLPLCSVKFPPISSLSVLIWVAGMVYAITKYRLMEVSVALASSEIISTMPDALILIRPDTRIIETNSFIDNLTGYVHGELTGKPVNTIFPDQPSLFSGSNFDQLLEKGAIHDFTMECRTKSGEYIPLSFSCAVVRDDAGEIIGIIGIGRDIRETLRNRQALLASEKMASLGRLSAGIAHEMNTPIAAVRTALHELGLLAEEYMNSINNTGVTTEDHMDIAEDMVKNISLAVQAAEKSAGFIKGIKSQASTEVLAENLTFNACELASDSLLVLEHLLIRGKCRLVMNIPETVFISGNPRAFGQIVSNLVMNAVDACKPGGGTITISITVNQENTVVLTVHDTGVGITKKNLAKIFEPFFTTKPFGEGTGLGLSIVYELVNEFGGTIKVESVPGNTVFRITFPFRNERSYGMDAD